MKALYFLLALKLIALVGATLNTVGFLAFFFLPKLEPYRWQLLISGAIIILVAELAVRKIKSRPL